METEDYLLIVKCVIALMLIGGGVYALRLGFKLYMNGVGLSHDGTTIEHDKAKASLKTVGSVVMTTSVAWGALGYFSSPGLKKGSDGFLEIASLSSSPVSSIRLAQLDLPGTSVDSERLLENTALFQQYLDSQSDKLKLVSLSGKPVRLGNPRVVREIDGDLYILASAVTTEGRFQVSYKPEKTETGLTLLPSELTVKKSSHEERSGGK